VAGHAVIVNVPLQGADGEFELVDGLGERLRERLESTRAGEFDGNLIGQDWGILYLYGDDADRLWDAIESEVRAASLPAGTYVVKQYGPPGGRETRIDL